VDVLPTVYGLPASLALILGGAVACFAGHRLFRIVLGIYGFIIGAMFTSSMMGVNSQMAMIAGAVVGGLVGSIVLVMAYFVGIALIGAGLGAVIGHSVWSWVGTGDPPALAVVVVSVAGALAAMMLQRYVIIAGTALTGAWTMILGIVNALAARGVTKGATASEVWILYPTSAQDAPWAPYAFVILTIAGIAVQLGITAKKK
jgi:Domain of unknown function (DUF4203)